MTRGRPRDLRRVAGFAAAGILAAALLASMGAGIGRATRPPTRCPDDVFTGSSDLASRRPHGVDRDDVRPASRP